MWLGSSLLYSGSFQYMTKASWFLFYPFRSTIIYAVFLPFLLNGKLCKCRNASLNRLPSCVLRYRLSSSASAKSVYASCLTEMLLNIEYFRTNHKKKYHFLLSLLSLLSTIYRQEKKRCSDILHLSLVFPEGFSSELEMSCPVSSVPIFLSCVDSHAEQ